MFDNAKLCMYVYILITRVTYQAISTVRTQTPYPSNYLFYTPQAMSNHVVVLAGYPNFDAEFVIYTSDMLSRAMTNITGLAYDDTAQIRTGAFNSYSNYSTTTILYFTPTTLKSISPFTSTISTLPITPGFSILDCCFGSTKTTIYTIMQDTILNRYYLFMYNGTAVSSSTYLSSINPSVDGLDEFFFEGDRLVLVFGSRIVVYGCVGLTLGAIVVTITYAVQQLEYIDAKVYMDLLVYSVGINLYLYNLTSLTLLHTYTSPNQIESITKTATNNYIILKTFSTFQQYDMDLNQVIQTSTTGLSLQKIWSLQNGQFVSWRDQLTYMTGLQILGTTADYTTYNSTCFSNYTLSGTICTKNTNLTITPAPINVTTTPLPANTTINSTVNTTTTNITGNLNIYVKPNAYTNVINMPNQKTQSTYSQLTEKYLSIFTTNSTSYIFSAATLKIMPKFLLVFTLLVNDLAFYQYHRKIDPTYPNSTLIFMEKFDMLKELGIQSLQSNLPFLSVGQDQLQEANTRNLARLQFDQHDPQQVYFLYALTDFGLSCLLLNTLYFSALKLAHLLLYWLRHQHLLLRNCYLSIRNQSKWWVLLVAIVEMNFTDLVLAVALQLLQPVSLCFFDKLNLAAMLLAFFVAVFYALAFYGLVYASQKHRNSRTLIVYCKERQMASYFFEPALVLVRSVSKTFTHGFLLCSYSAQIAALLLLDVCFLVLCLSRLRSFRNKPIACLLTAYFLGFLLFDLFFVAEIYTDVTEKWDRELIGFIICCSLAGISLLMCLVFLISSLISSCKSIKDFCQPSRISSEQIQAQAKEQHKFRNISFKNNNNAVELRKIQNEKQPAQKNDDSININSPIISTKVKQKTRRRYKVHAQKRKKSIEKLNIFFQSDQKNSNRIQGIVEIKLKDGKKKIKHDK